MNTNQHFLQRMFGDQWERAHLATFHVDPRQAGPAEWLGGPAKFWISRCLPEHNNYYAVSLFHGDRRVERQFDRLFVLGIDDVGPKVDPDAVLALMGEPTYRIETSPDNEQWGYRLEQPLSGVRRSRELIRALRIKLTGGDARDPGMESVTRYLRLPFGANTKGSAL